MCVFDSRDLSERKGQSAVKGDAALLFNPTCIWQRTNFLCTGGVLAANTGPAVPVQGTTCGASTPAQAASASGACPRSPRSSSVLRGALPAPAASEKRLIAYDLVAVLSVLCILAQAHHQGRRSRSVEAERNIHSTSERIVELVQLSQAIVIAWNRTGNGFPTGGIESYDFAISFALPDPLAMSLSGRADPAAGTHEMAWLVDPRT